MAAQLTMLLEHFHLAEQPFGEAPDTRFWFFGRTHREALSTLVCEIENRRGIALVTGSAGMGKTSLLLRFQETVQPPVRGLLAPTTARSPYRLARWLLRELRPATVAPDEELHGDRLHEHLIEECLPGHRLILLIDEAETLSARTLDWLCQLSASGFAAGTRLQLVVSGQPRLIERLNHDRLSHLRERVGCVVQLRPFDAEETQQYVRHRLWIAGGSRKIFSEQALARIAEISGGIPRTINNLCSAALPASYALGKQRVDEQTIEEASGDMASAILRSAIAETHDSDVLLPAAEVCPKGVRSGLSEITHARDFRCASSGTNARGWLSVAAIVLVLACLGAASLVKAARAHGVSASIPRRPNRAVVSAAPLSSEPSVRSSAATSTPPLAAPQVIDKKAPSAESASQAVLPQRVATVVVEPGTTIRQLSLAYMGRYNSSSVAEICALNRLADPNRIFVGQKLRVPVMVERPFSQISAATRNTSVDASETLP